MCTDTSVSIYTLNAYIDMHENLLSTPNVKDRCPVHTGGRCAGCRRRWRRPSRREPSCLTPQPHGTGVSKRSKRQPCSIQDDKTHEINITRCEVLAQRPSALKPLHLASYALTHLETLLSLYPHQVDKLYLSANGIGRFSLCSPKPAHKTDCIHCFCTCT